MPTGTNTGDRRVRKRRGATRPRWSEPRGSSSSSTGLPQPPIEDITETRRRRRAHVLFRHFPSKEAVLFGDPSVLETHFRSTLLTRPAGEDIGASLRATLVEIGESVVAPARERTPPSPRILHENGDPRLEDHLGALSAKSTCCEMRSPSASAPNRPTRTQQLLGGVVVTIIDVAYRQWIETGAGDDITTIVMQTFDKPSIDSLRPIRPGSG